MALITRLSRLFEADFHAVLDRIEEPELQLKQAVREMQFAVDQGRQRIKLLQHEAGQLQARAAETGTQEPDPSVPKRGILFRRVSCWFELMMKTTGLPSR